jgi:WD40 repeat protein
LLAGSSPLRSWQKGSNWTEVLNLDGKAPASLSKDGSTLAVMGSPGNRYVRVLNVTNNFSEINSLATNSMGSYDFTAMEISPDGKYVITVENSYPGDIKFWQISDGQLLRSLSADGLFAFAPASSVLAYIKNDLATSSTTIYFRQYPDFSLRQSIVTTNRVDALAFTPDGYYLATVEFLSSNWGSGGTYYQYYQRSMIRFYRLSDGAVVKTYDAQVYGANRLVFSSDSSLFAYNRVDATLVVASNPFGTNAPAIQAQPQNQVLSIGKELSLTAAVLGTRPLFYQWYKDQKPISNATNDTLHILALSSNDAGSYYYSVSNQFGFAACQSFNITVNSAVGPQLSVAMFAGLTIWATPGIQCQIQYVTDLSKTNNWIPLTNLTVTASPYLFFDVTSTNSQKRYYQAVQSP